ncbi:MAG: cell division/cell wall cluster transcriptional repressor MraZ [SAR86 cluster bacterium]|uniref:Transcriptional regulator MraZ n=1 Tax=SAR86 cluster bacterium TaxID=2030880 RepID=A0A2A5B158_9GAMM|nr:MAG: cell division/cell wall cluster transcriptional repressor MraZ [SAR86 cluster bacterium]
MFRGINTINLDAKGRLAMPARYRELLASQNIDQLVVTIDPNHSCLMLYPVAEWDQIERQIESLSSFDPVTQRIKHLLIGHATDLELDGSGRILLPQELRLYAKLEKHVCLIGQGKKLEIWSQEIWSQQRDKWLGESSTEGEFSDKLHSLPL